MGTKLNPGKFDCYTRAEPDEPMFVLLGRDPVASRIVRQWMVERQAHDAAIGRPAGPDSLAKFREAAACADAMDIWRTAAARAFRPAIPDPHEPGRAAELHAMMATMLAQSLVRSVVTPGGDTVQIMALLESVVVGVLAAVVRLGGREDDETLKLMHKEVVGRLAKLRQAAVPAAPAEPA
jgi:hypothetical protein